MTFYGAWLGPRDSMFLTTEIEGSQSQTATFNPTYRPTISGRLRGQVAPLLLREWDCEIPSAALEHASQLRALGMGLYGEGPFAWVPITAANSNVLTPASSMPGPKYAKWLASESTGIGAWKIPEYGIVRHAVALNPRSDGKDTFATLAEDGMVAPGFPVTGSVYVMSANERPVTFYLQVMREDGTIDVQERKEVSTPDGPVRVHGTIAPDRMTEPWLVRIRLTNAAAFAMPAISWTYDLVPWTPGGGSNSVHIDGFGGDFEYLSQCSGLYETTKFTVKELASDA